MYVFVCVYVYICMYICMNVYNVCMCLFVCVCVCVHVPVYVRMFIYYFLCFRCNLCTRTEVFGFKVLDRLSKPSRDRYPIHRRDVPLPCELSKGR